MNVLVVLIPVAMLLGLGALGAFMWALRTGQYEDLDGAAWRILSSEDEDGPAGPSDGPEPAAGGPRGA
jgi:cbb3-type cytochrome oxidase maturation protein